MTCGFTSVKTMAAPGSTSAITIARCLYSHMRTQVSMSCSVPLRARSAIIYVIIYATNHNTSSGCSVVAAEPEPIQDFSNVLLYMLRRGYTQLPRHVLVSNPDHLIVGDYFQIEVAPSVHCPERIHGSIPLDTLMARLEGGRCSYNQLLRQPQALHRILDYLSATILDILQGTDDAC